MKKRDKEDNKIKEYHDLFLKVKNECKKTIVGQDRVIEGLLRGIICDGHILIEGVPGIAKTLIVKTLAKITGGTYNRVQFTADLLPTDITGLTTYERDKGFSVIKGPVFANFIIADEINRSPPKVQSALLEAMQEKQVTIGRTTYPLPLPFFVMATQNPIESAGVYNLPEAQIDRFLFKINIYYPTSEEETEILKRNITLYSFDDYNLKKVIDPKKIIEVQNFVRDIYVNKSIEKYITRIVDATRHPDKYKVSLGKYIEWGSSPRASIGMFIASKAEALLRGQKFVTPHHVKTVAHDVLRHRILLNYEGQAENVSRDDIVSEILNKVPMP
ncbi:MoxR family ATPase [Candidatus Woesearchaeota archaeon]|nr:MoxR family ATPase [Candidatus Woesearchaeota archaeon]